MDVRCDLCQTEYELDDDSVSDAGASVQCTTCGHTFVVGRNGVRISATPASPAGGAAGGTAADAGPQAADWLLATEDGQTHRFRDLTTLQKWVVERKVTREDRVSQKGGRWRPLSEVVELEPFFDVVAQADRARAAEAARRAAGREPAPSAAHGGAYGGRHGGTHGSTHGSTSATPHGATSGTTPTRQTTLSRQAAAHMGRPNGGVADGARTPPPRRDSVRSRLLDPANVTTTEEDALDALSLLSGGRRLKIAGAAAMVVLAGIAAYVGFQRPHWIFGKPAEPPRIAEAPPVPAPPVPRAPPPVAAGTAPAAPSPASPPVPASRPIIEAMPGPGSRPAPADRGAPGDSPGAAPRGKSYERLVADADRLLENGQNARAQKLVDEALALQPDGVAAITTSAYLLLDREKHLAAISTFKRALSLSPGYATALFGLAEAYRAQGEAAQAVESYRKYLEVSPGGSDASAARRQLKDLEGAAKKAPAPAASAPETDPPAESAKLEERRAPSAEDRPAP